MLFSLFFKKKRKRRSESKNEIKKRKRVDMKDYIPFQKKKIQDILFILAIKIIA